MVGLLRCQAAVQGLLTTAMFRNAMGPQPGCPIKGQYWQSKIMASMGAPTTAGYAALVKTARAAMMPEAMAAPARLAPTAAMPHHMRHTADGGEFVKKDVTLRLVPEVANKERHINQALKVPFPQPSTRYELTPDLTAAIRTMSSMDGARLTALRRKQINKLRDIARATSSLSAQLKRNTPGVPNSVKHLRRQINIVFLAVLFDAMGWQDQDLCRGLLRGFHVAGDLSQQKSNIFCPNDSENIFNPADWKDFCSHDSNMEWLQKCSKKLTDQGLKAKREAQADDAEALVLLRAVQTKTQIEVEISMHMGPAMITANLIKAYSINNKFPVTVVPRFGIWQGHKMVITKEGIEVHFLDAQGQEVRKLRCIDDFKINGINAHTVLADKIVLPNFELPARIAAEIFELLGGKKRLSSPWVWMTFLQPLGGFTTLTAGALESWEFTIWTAIQWTGTRS